MSIEKLVPYFTFKIWGGEKLLRYKTPNKLGNYPLGETWEVSRHPDGESTISSGQKLGELYSKEELPYLVKFIDTADDLSIQVHPGDDYARKYENDQGKTECWLILEADKGAGIYLGLKDGVTKQSLEEAIAQNKEVDQFLNFYEVASGDFFYVPAGSIHAIGRGVTLAEIQQSSGITYRVWDWNRLDKSGKSRELHVNKALDVITLDKEKNQLSSFKFSRGNLGKKAQELIIHSDFEVTSYKLEAGEKLSFLSSKERAVSIVNLEGEISVNDVQFKKYECGIISKNLKLEIKSLTCANILIIS